MQLARPPHNRHHDVRSSSWSFRTGFAAGGRDTFIWNWRNATLMPPLLFLLEAPVSRILGSRIPDIYLHWPLWLEYASHTGRIWGPLQYGFIFDELWLFSHDMRIWQHHAILQIYSFDSLIFTPWFVHVEGIELFFTIYLLGRSPPCSVYMTIPNRFLYSWIVGVGT